MKTTGINWLFKKKVVKTNNLKKCATCPNNARNSMSKYCLDCIDKQAKENNRKQSLRRYYKKYEKHAIH